MKTRTASVFPLFQGTELGLQMLETQIPSTQNGRDGSGRSERKKRLEVNQTRRRGRAHQAVAWLVERDVR